MSFIALAEDIPTGLSPLSLGMLNDTAMHIAWAIPMHPNGAVSYSVFIQGSFPTATALPVANASLYNLVGVLLNTTTAPTVLSDDTSEEGYWFNMLGSYQGSTGRGAPAVFDGNTSFQALTNGPNLQNQRSFSFIAEFTQDPNITTGQYLFAKTQGGSGQRMFSVYLTPPSTPAGSDGRLYFFYTPANTTASRSVRYTVAVADGARHVVVLSVSPSPTATSALLARLFVDNATIGSFSIPGGIADCGDRSPTCVVQIGANAPSALLPATNFFQGTIYTLAMLPYAALQAPPGDLSVVLASRQQISVLPQHMSAADTYTTVTALPATVTSWIVSPVHPLATYVVQLEATTSAGGTRSSPPEVIYTPPGLAQGLVPPQVSPQSASAILLRCVCACGIACRTCGDVKCPFG